MKTKQIILWAIVLIVLAIGYVRIRKGDTALHTQSADENMEQQQLLPMHIVSPNGGESLDANTETQISYTISDQFINSLPAGANIELYLLNENNALIRYIGKAGIIGKFNWTPNKSLSNQELDQVIAPIETGQYKILIVARPENKKANCSECDGPAPATPLGTSNENIVYENGKLKSLYSFPEFIYDVFGADVSDELFAVQGN